MKHRTFMWFILPSLAAMVLFIALPIISVFTQSLFIKHDKVLIEAEVCGPFGCKIEVSVDSEATKQIRKDKPL
jgi:multiple sugar transport system permease protein